MILEFVQIGNTNIYSQLKYLNEIQGKEENLEKKIVEENVKLFILCNPHNPIGMMWEKDDLIKIGNLCLKYNVLVISDEIHCDFIDPGLNYVPFASISDEFKNNSITCISTSKTFNLAGIQGSCIVVPNEKLHKLISEAFHVDCIGEINYFSAEANIAALTYGKTWVKELNEYIYENKEYVRNFVKENGLDVYLVPCNSTYFLWIDVSNFTNDADLYTEYSKSEIDNFVQKTVGNNAINDSRRFFLGL